MSLSSASVFLTQISRIHLLFQSPRAMFPPVNSQQLHSVQSPIHLSLSWVPSHVGAISHSQDQVVLNTRCPLVFCAQQENGSWSPSEALSLPLMLLGTSQL